MKNSAGQLQSIFGSAVKSRGGVAAPENYPEQLRPLLIEEIEEFRRILDSTKGSMRPQYVAHNIYLDVIDDPTLNAMAFEHQGHEFVGINSGTIFFLYDTFLALFSHPRFMPEIGNSKEETTSGAELKQYLLRKNISRIHDFPPKDISRRFAAQLMAQNAYHFVLGHEVGHLTMAHIKFLQANYGLEEYPDYGPLALVGEETRHCMEADADSNGTQASLNIFGPRPLRTSAEFGDVRTDFRTWAMSIGVIFALFDLHRQVHYSDAAKSHPNPDIRFFNAIASSWEETNRRVPKLVASCKEQTYRSAVELCEFFVLVELPHEPFKFADRRASREKLNDRLGKLAERRSAIQRGIANLAKEGLEEMAILRSEKLRHILENRLS